MFSITLVLRGPERSTRKLSPLAPAGPAGPAGPRKPSAPPLDRPAMPIGIVVVFFVFLLEIYIHEFPYILFGLLRSANPHGLAVI